ncbi:MetQ/NlpA family ABC transporter substrate-binding protein [Luedemannella flava]|uniref:MetQ/NlpA family ABC transporter substrate-binding protein n=1 Tax=Luedemannella flava TaxID=349316 RepID=A0ABN2LXJ0_9ACTN
MKKVLALSLIATMAIGLSGCTDSDSPTTSATTSPGLRHVRVAALPIAETAALWAGISQGIFARHGLEVEVLPAQGGALAIPALTKGDLEFAIGQPFGPFRADLQDLGVVIVGNYASSYAGGDDINAVVAAKASGITRPRDLAGRKVSVNSLGAAGDVTIMESVAQDGGDPSTIKFVEVAFPDVPAQLQAGNIDAGWVTEPFVSQLKARGDTFIVAPYQKTIPGLPTLTAFTTAKLTTEQPALVNDFAAAMKETLAWAKDPANNAALRQALKAKMTSLPPAVADSLRLPDYTWTIDKASLQKLIDLAVKYKVLPKSPNLDRLVQQK